MLKLKVNNQNVDMGQNPRITLDEQSPVFDRKGIKGGHALPFTLPGTPLNNKIFEFPNRVERSEYPSRDFDFQLFHSGKLRAMGTISVKQTTSKNLQAYLKLGSGNFYSQIQGKKIADCDYGGLRSFVKKGEYTYPTDDFTLFPINNTGLYYDTDLNQDFIDNLYKINAYISGEFLTTGTDIYAIIPFPFLNYVLKTIFKEFGFSIIDSVFNTDQDLRSLVFYNNYAITQVLASWDDKVIDFGDNPAGDPISQKTREGGVIQSIADFDLKNHLPDMLISELIISLQNTFNLSFIFDNENNVRIIKRKKLINKPATVDISDEALDCKEIIIETKPDGFMFTWDRDEDDNSIESLFKSIDDVLDNIKDPLQSESDLETLEPEPNEIRYIIDSDWYLIFAAVQTDAGVVFQWQIFSWGELQNYTIGNGLEVIVSKFSPLFFNPAFTYHIGMKVKCPMVGQEGNVIVREDFAPFKPRLMFYRGMQKDNSNNDYPMGSCDVLDYHQNKIADANLSLRWDGEYGLYENCWKEYLYWWMNRKLVKWIIKDPSRIDFDKIYSINRSNYLLKKKSTVLSLHKIEPAVCEFYSV